MSHFFVKFKAIILVMFVLSLLLYLPLGYSQNDVVLNSYILELKNKDSDMRRKAALELGKLKNPYAVKPLIAALKDTDFLVVRAAIEALSKIGEQAVAPLIEVLKNSKKDNDWAVSRSAEEALSGIEDSHAVEPLIIALKDKDPDVCRNAAFALGKIKDPRAIEPLIAALKNNKTRYGAAYVLGEFKDLRAVKPLLETLNDNDPEVRYRTAISLGMLKDALAVKSLIKALKDEYGAARRAAREALVAIGSSAIGPLIEGLSDKNLLIRFNSAYVLTKIISVEQLLSLLNHDNLPLRLAVAWALQIKEPEQAEINLRDFFNNVDFSNIAKDYKPILKRRMEIDQKYLLIFTLEKYGNRDMALDFLKSGDPLLEDVVYAWADRHRYTIIH